VIARVDADIVSHGLDLLSRRHAGDYAGFRPVDLAAAMNRLRTLRVTSSLPAGAKTGKEEEDPLTGPRSAHR
jgi:hypothetical protein